MCSVNAHFVASNRLNLDVSNLKCNENLLEIFLFFTVSHIQFDLFSFAMISNIFAFSLYQIEPAVFVVLNFVKHAAQQRISLKLHNF